jgi:hypothetical protein
MKRYDMQYRPDWAYNQASMMPSDNGEYAKFEEANTRIAELTAEVARYKAALEEIGGDRWVSYMWDSDVWHSMQEIARNALKDGV